MARAGGTRHNRGNSQPGLLWSKQMLEMQSRRLTAPSSQIRAFLNSRWAVVFWVACVCIAIASSIVVSPRQFDQAVHLSDPSISDPAAMRDSLAGLGLTPAFIAWAQVATVAVNFLVTTVVAWLLLQRRPRTGFIFLIALSFGVSGAAVYPPSIHDLLPDQPGWAFVIRLLTVFSMGFFFMFAFFFPDGRYVPRWAIVPILYNVIAMLAVGFFHDLPDSPGGNAVNAVLTLLFVGSIVYSTIYRYRHVSDREQQRQTKWVVLGILFALPGFFLGDAMMRNIGPGLGGVLCLIGFMTIIPIATNALPVTIGIAMLRNRLFDIDLILNRTLVWLTMTALVVLAYVGIVVGIGGLIGVDQSWLLSIVVTGLVAVAFQPIHLRVQGLANRLLYGDRDDPYSVMNRIGQKIEDSVNRDDLLPAIVRTTAEALRLPYAALLLRHGDGLVLAAASGRELPGAQPFPLSYQGESLGVLMVAPRSRNESFGPADRRLLDDLARQIGVAVHTLRLADDLQRSRERLVSAREEERRRLRRDLHDGLGAQLAALSMQAGAIRALIPNEPEQATQETLLLQRELRNAVADIRRLVHGLRPPALDELGLIGALRERLERIEAAERVNGQTPMRATLEAPDPLPPLSAATEVAILRIVEEAVTNIARHANASRICVRIGCEGNTLALAIEDDGVGMPAGHSPGVGLVSMRERVVELGGQLMVANAPDGGVLIEARIPIAIAPGEAD